MYASSSKRRRTSMSSTASLASRGDDDTGSLDLEYQPDTKRKKVVKLDPIEQCQQLYDIIRGHKKEDGSVLCEPFIRVPKRRQEPSYYEVVNNPMDMIRIQQKIKMDEYEDVDQMSTDVDLMVANAKAFYKRSSQEYKDACELWELFIESKCRLFDRDSPFEDGERKGKIILKMGKLARRAALMEAKKPALGDIDGGETSESSTTTDKGDRQEDQTDATLAAQLEELFSAVMLACDADGRALHTVFQLLPSKKRYPEYYDVIDNPIDLKMIATKIQGGEYQTLYELEKDLHLMCKNACAFNEPGSSIYKDAKALKKVVSNKKTDIEYGRPTGTTPGKTSERIRNRRLRSGLSHSAITAALSYEDDEEDEEMEDEEIVEEEQEDEDVGEEVEEDDNDVDHVDDAENPMWILYESVNSMTSSTGAILSDPFRRLPSRRFYPDYYKEIKFPISLSQIKMKIRRGEYGNVTQVQADMNIMFENAKTYNRTESSLYKTAVKLQKVMQLKVQDLLLVDEDVSNDDMVGVKGTTTPIPLLTPETDIENSTSFTGSPLESGPNSSGSSRTPSAVVKKITPKSKPKELLSAHSFSFLKNIVKDEKISKPSTFKDQMKRRFMILYRTLLEYVEMDGRGPISMFMEKPSKKLYPDYYRVIPEPIDMVSIKTNIESDMYTCTAELIKDFKLMFNNCRQYNEEGSAIYEDANKLEKLLNETIKEIGPDPTIKAKTKKKKNPVQLQKQKKLLDTVKDHKDKNGRMLSTIFQKLPSKMEYPEYYEVIKNPIDLDRICHKHKTNAYESLDQLSADIMLMFDNACKFNEPDSQIYKDALILQRLVLQTKLSLSADDGRVPDVPGIVREILISIFTSVYNHQDEEGRCFTDTMAEVPEYDEKDSIKVRALSLDLIKSRLDRGFYKRLDTFQKDMFICFERARKFSRTDSQLFEDSVELNSFFIRTRDEICGKGDTLKSPALLFTQSDLDKSVEALRTEKKSQEIPQDEDLSLIEPKKEEAAAAPSSQSESYNEQTFCVGDFVYVSASPNYNGSEPLGSDGANQSASGTSASSKGTVKPNIANIQKLWTAPDGTKMFEGIFFFRPDQTYHIPTRKFLEKEVFRSEVRSTAQLSEIVGKCWVMTVKGKEYFNYAPEGYADEHVYVCEYRYSSRGRSFCKLKSWAFGSERVKLIARPKPLELIRVASVFKERLEKHKEELQHLEDDVDKVSVEEFSNIELAAPIVGKEDLTYYIQYSLPCGPIRAGDYVYVRVENAKKLVAKVDTMWADSNGTTYFHGPWFTSLAEVSPSSVPPGRTFYKQEIFQSSIEDTNPLLSICGKCSVLEVNEFTRFRLTELPEDDVYVCESMYEEARRQIKKFDGLKKTEHHDRRVHQDEVYFFRRPISLVKVDIEGNVIPEMPKLKAATNVIKVEQSSPITSIKMEVDSAVEDSNDGPPPSLIVSETPATPVPVISTPATPTTTHTTKKSKTPGKKIVTGYILYSSEVRKFVAEKNPSSGFGEISRIVGNDWRKMSATEKQVYEERAARMNEEKEAAFAAGLDPSTVNAKMSSQNAAKETDLLSIVAALKKDADWIFECCWDGCDWQFEDALDLMEHCVQEPKGHVPTSFKEPHVGKEGKNVPTDGEYQCHWKNCARVKKGVNPFPTLPRLLKHVKDIHILKGNGRIIHPDMRSKNIHLSRSTLASKAAEAKEANANNSGPGNSAQAVQPIISRPPAPPPEPLFVAVPPRPQKLLHSEAYIKYIESLHNEQRHITNWGKTLSATAQNSTAPDPAKLPSHWLRNRNQNPTAVVNALWALRDFMLKDQLNLR